MRDLPSKELSGFLNPEIKHKQHIQSHILQVPIRFYALVNHSNVFGYKSSYPLSRKVTVKFLKLVELLKCESTRNLIRHNKENCNTYFQPNIKGCFSSFNFPLKMVSLSFQLLRTQFRNTRPLNK